MTMMCGLLGLPPVNGVIPQSPMHTKSLAHIEGQEHPKKSDYSSRRKITPNEPQGSDSALDQLDLASKDNVRSSSDDKYISLQVSEQRGSGLFQSLAVGACLGLTPAIRWIPTAVLWGYAVVMFIKYLAILKDIAVRILSGTSLLWRSNRFQGLNCGIELCYFSQIQQGEES